MLLHKLLVWKYYKRRVDRKLGGRQWISNQLISIHDYDDYEQNAIIRTAVESSIESNTKK